MKRVNDISDCFTQDLEWRAIGNSFCNSERRKKKITLKINLNSSETPDRHSQVLCSVILWGKDKNWLCFSAYFRSNQSLDSQGHVVPTLTKLLPVSKARAPYNPV